MSPPRERSSKPAKRVNWRWVIGCGIAGALLIAAAFALEHFCDWQGVSLETMVSIGAAVLLAGVLFFLERRFLTEVGDVATTAARVAADARIDERTQEVSSRLDQLDERTNELREERERRQDESVRGLDVPTAQSVANALAEANRIGAIADGHVTVQASRDLTEFGLEFSWGADAGDGRFGIPARAILMVRGRVYADERSGGSRPVIEAEWRTDESTEQVGLRIREQLERRGRWLSDSTLDWPMALRNLKKSLDLAIRSRRRDGSPGLIQGALFELVGDDWAITDAGLECPSHDGYVFRESEFPERYSMRTMREKKTEPWRPEPPVWVDAALWDELLERGRWHLPIYRGPMRGTPSWVPLRGGPTPGASSGTPT